MLESGKVRIPTDKQSDEMAAFIKANQGGTYSISGADADKFRVNAQTGEVTSKKFMHFIAWTLMQTPIILILTIVWVPIVLLIKLI